MEKRSIIAILLLCGLSAHAVSRHDYIFSNTNWKAGMNVTPALNRGSVSGLSTLGNLSYKSLLGFSAGAHFSKRLGNKNIFLETGLNYSVSGVKYSREAGHGFELEFEAEKETVTERFGYFSLPVRAMFYESNNRLRKFLSLGANLNVLVKQSQFQTLQLAEGGLTTNAYPPTKGRFARIAPSFRVGFGWEYDLEQDFSFRVEPFVGFTYFAGKQGISMLSFGVSVAAQFQGN